VQVENLVKKFGEVVAVNGLSFDVEEGEIFGLIGPDGAGKTTALRILSGVMELTSGSVEISGVKIPGGEEKVKEFIGYMPQKFSLYPDMTVDENVDFFAQIYGIEKDLLNERLKPLLNMTRLDKFRDRLAEKLSGGMKQKLALMATLIHRPKLLILDEPTTGVDPVSRREFWEILREIALEGITVIISTPYMDEAQWCSRTGLIFNGSMLMSGKPSSLIDEFNGIVMEGEQQIINNNLKETLKDSGLLNIRVIARKVRMIFKSKDFLTSSVKDMIDKFNLTQVKPTIEDIFIAGIIAAGKKRQG
jgi:ABC-2 type transport system ATP-binding protein